MSHRVLVALAAILVLAGCGGGGGGPSVDVSTDADYRRTNSNATDLLDTWNDPGPVLQALGTAPVPAGEHAQRIGQLRELLAGQAPGGDTLTRLRNVDPANMRIVGERDGITYGQWKAGPAGRARHRLLLEVRAGLHRPASGRWSSAPARSGPIASTTPSTARSPCAPKT